jgi:hypothetical protein
MTDVPTPHGPDADFPAHGTDDEKLRFVLQYAVRAPSGHNTQPWQFEVSDGALRVYADRGRRLPVVDPDDRALTISCGAAAVFASVALRHHGYAGVMELLPDPADQDLLVSVRLSAGHHPTPADEALFEAITSRHTHRAAFEDRPVPARVLEQMHRDADSLGAELRLVEDNAREHIAELVAEGDRAQFADREFREELSEWVRSNHTRSEDGMPGYAFGMGDLVSLLGPWFIRHVDTGSSQADKDRRSALHAPALAVLGTPGDNAVHWLAAGQALGLLLLRGAAHGVQGSFLNQPIETTRLRSQVRELLHLETHPQLLLRIGYASGDTPTPRRQPPMREVAGKGHHADE